MKTEYTNVLYIIPGTPWNSSEASWSEISLETEDTFRLEDIESDLWRAENTRTGYFRLVAKNGAKHQTKYYRVRLGERACYTKHHAEVIVLYSVYFLNMFVDGRIYYFSH
jgi:hypothetical protein